MSRVATVEAKRDKRMHAYVLESMTYPNDLLSKNRGALNDLYPDYDLLFPAFLFPGVPRSIVFRADDSADSVNLKDFPSVRVPLQVSYVIPRRNLAGSDTAMARLSIKGNIWSGDNRHPGTELLIPLEGSVAVMFEDGNTMTASAEKKELLHFDSSRIHRVINQTNAPIRLIAFRFYGERTEISLPPRAGGARPAAGSKKSNRKRR